MQESIQKTSKLCTNILSTLQQSPSPSPSQSSVVVVDSLNPHAPLSSVRSDFITLCTALGKECTSFSLACKPPTSEKAALGVLDNLVNLLGKMKVCLLATGSLENGGGALAREIK